MNEKMVSAINEQINAETFSAYLYMAMAAYFESKNLKGFANWMNVQAKEELFHALKFFNFVNERGGRVKLTAIAAPQTDWSSTKQAFEEVLKHEQYITSRIQKLYETARELRDSATEIFLQWYINEQVEEEASATQVLEQLKLLDQAPGGIYMLDRELAQRQFVSPAAEGAAQ